MNFSRIYASQKISINPKVLLNKEKNLTLTKVLRKFLFLKEIDHKITTTYKCGQATKLLKRQSDLLCLHPIVPTASLLAQKIKTYLTQS